MSGLASSTFSASSILLLLAQELGQTKLETDVVRRRGQRIAQDFFGLGRLVRAFVEIGQRRGRIGQRLEFRPAEERRG